MSEHVVAKVQLGRRRPKNEHRLGSAQRLHDFSKETPLVVGVIMGRGFTLRMTRNMLRSVDRRLLERRGADAKDVRPLVIDPNCALSIAHMTRSLSSALFNVLTKPRARLLAQLERRQ